MENKFMIHEKYIVKIAKDFTTTTALTALLGEQFKQIIGALIPEHWLDFKRWLDKYSLLLAIERKDAESQLAFQGIFFSTFQPSTYGPQWVIVTAPAGNQKGKETVWATECCTIEEYRQGRGKE
jgi:hypothetical protein